MEKMSKNKMRDVIVWSAAIIAFIVGVFLTIAGFFVPPTGDISGTVLTALGEFLTFFGSVFGIGKYTDIQLAKIKQQSEEEQQTNI